MKKLTYAFYLFILLGILYGANRLDEKHFETAQHTVNSIYNDRVVAQHLVYQLSSVFNDRHLQYLTDTSVNKKPSNVDSQNNIVVSLVEQFRGTVLTLEEDTELQQLEKNFASLIQQEKLLINSTSNSLQGVREAFSKINKTLDNLSKIQLSESKNLKALGQKSLESNLLMSYTEIAFMIVLGIVILFIIFYKGS